MGPVASVPLAEVQNVLQHWLANLQQRPPESRYGCVLVATPEQARGRSFDIVFIPGLAERMFPQKLREDPLLLDKLRRQLSSDLSVLSDRSQQERLLLQIAVGAASRRLYLSYPRLEVAEARARVPSFYALDVARSITGHVPDYEVLAREAELAGASRLAWPAPRDPSEASTMRSTILATVWPLLNTNESRAGRLAYVMKLNSYLARSLRGRWARWQEKWSEHDGLFTKTLVDRYDTRVPTSRGPPLLSISPTEFRGLSLPVPAFRDFPTWAAGRTSAAGGDGPTDQGRTLPSHPGGAAA